MKCEDALLLISGHMDKENTTEEEKALQAHLCACESCRSTLRMLEEIDSETAALREPAPTGLCADVMAQIKKETAVKKRRPWYGIAIAAALTLVIGAGAAVGFNDNSDELQTISATDMQTMRRALPDINADVLAQELAQERNAPVVLVHEMYYEMETHPCETLEEGYLLYLLPDHDAAVVLGEYYGCVIYEPSGEATGTISYALLVP